MGTLNEILSFMYKMDKGYRETVNLNEDSNAYMFLVEDKRINQARQRSRDVIRNKFYYEYSRKLSDEEVDAVLQKFENEFYHDPKMRSGQTMRLEPLFCRLALEFGFGQDNRDTDVLERLLDILKMMFTMQSEIDLSKIDIFNTSYDQLENEYGTMLDSKFDTETQEIASTEYTPNNYQILGPLTYEQAHEIGNKSCPNSKLCYTQSESTWNSGNYANKGINNAYVALIDGWDDETLFPAVHDEDFVSPYDKNQIKTDESPYDKYGLSMIFVFVGPNGNLATCNTRWNHRADYPYGVEVDKALTRKQISEIIGQKFFEVFKPSNYLEEMLNNVLSELQDGATLDEVFSDVLIPMDNPNAPIGVGLNGKYNFFKDGKFLCSQWFDNIGRFYEDYAVVKLNDKSNYVNTKGRLMFRKWVDWCCSFKNGYAIIESDGVCNIINTSFKYILKEWYTDVTEVENGLFWKVRKGYKYNYVNQYGELIWKHEDINEWFDRGDSRCDENTFRVRIGYKYGYLTLDGKILGGQLFDVGGNFVNGRAAVSNADQNNFIKPDGTFLFREWLAYCESFSNGFAVIGKRNITLIKFNYINPNGELLWRKPIHEWFDRCQNFKGDKAQVAVQVNDGLKINLLRNDGTLLWNKNPREWFDRLFDKGKYFKVMMWVHDRRKINFLNQNGELVWKHPKEEWFDFANDLENDMLQVCLKVNDSLKETYIDLDGNLVFGCWFDDMESYMHYSIVCCKGKYNYINTLKKKYIRDVPWNQWFDGAGEFREGYAKVNIAHKYNYMNSEGEFLWKHPSEEWFDRASGFFHDRTANVVLQGMTYVIDTNGKLTKLND